VAPGSIEAGVTPAREKSAGDDEENDVLDLDRPGVPQAYLPMPSDRREARG